MLLKVNYTRCVSDNTSIYTTYLNPLAISSITKEKKLIEKGKRVRREDIDKYDWRQLTSYRISPDIYAYYILINTKGKDEVNNIKLMYETEEECDEYLDELTYEWERTLKEISKCI